MAAELDDEELSDPIEAFAKLSQRVQDGHLDMKRGFAQTQQAIALVQEQTEQALALVQQQAERALEKAMTAAAPDYTNDIKELKRAVQTMEAKPLLGVTMERLEGALEQGCTRGNAPAVSALRSVEAGYKEAQGQRSALLKRMEEAEWWAYVLLIIVTMLAGGYFGVLFSDSFAKPVKVPYLAPVATVEDCKTTGGTLGQDKEKRPVCHISVRP